MAWHRYSIWQIAVWILHWQAQHIRDKAPYINPAAEHGGPPEWWYQFYAEWTWWQNIGSYNVPTPTLISYAMRGTWRLIGLWVDEVGNWARDTAEDAVRGWVGYVRGGLTTFSAWIYWLEGITGTWVPWWTDSLASAATRLYNWLPSDIRSAAASWYDKFRGWYDAANAWAWGQFQAAKDWVANNAPWAIDWINFLINWYNAVGQWIVSFRNDPYGTVAGWLGYSWTVWVSLREGLRTFYNTVWTPFRADMFAFFDHPMLFLYDKTEDFLCERW